MTVKPFLRIEARLETELEDNIEEERPEEERPEEERPKEERPKEERPKEERPIEQPNDRTTLLTVKRRRSHSRKHPLPKATNALIVDILIFI